MSSVCFTVLLKSDSLKLSRSVYGAEQVLSSFSYAFKPGETYPKILSSFEEFKALDIPELLKNGYTSVSINDLPSEIRFVTDDV